MRALTRLESDVAAAIVSFAKVREWEFSASLEAPQGPLIEIRTLMRPDGADPSDTVLARAKAGGQVVIHHNHLSQESLSDTDWRGLAELFTETFAHCADGTRYWGRVKDPQAVQTVLTKSDLLEIEGGNLLFSSIMNHSHSTDIASFFRKEILNRAMRLRGYVDYEYVWGALQVPPFGPYALPWSAGDLGKNFDSYIDSAAAALAPRI